MPYRYNTSSLAPLNRNSTFEHPYERPTNLLQHPLPHQPHTLEGQSQGRYVVGVLSKRTPRTAVPHYVYWF